jgi:hypothetical protein
MPSPRKPFHSHTLVAPVDKICDRTGKKTAHVSGRDRPDIVRWCEDWFDGQLDLDPECLVFIDETRPQPTWPGRVEERQGRTASRRHSAWPLEDDFRRWVAADGNGRAPGPRRTDQWHGLPDLCRSIPRPDACAILPVFSSTIAEMRSCCFRR